MTIRSTTFPLAVLVLAVTAPAFADDMKPEDYRGALLRCNPSCYEPAHPGPAKKVKVCAYLPFHFVQAKQGKAWGKLEASSAMDPIAVPGCKFPTSVPKKWEGVVAEARHQLKLKKGDFVTVAPDVSDWSIEKDDLERVTVRTVLVDLYSRENEDFDRCGSGDPYAVCEPDNNAVTAFNQVSYRVAEAKKLQQAGKSKECRLAAWDAISQGNWNRNERTSHVASKTWKAGLSYASRYDGILNEQQLFEKNDAYEKESRALWAVCGGPGEINLGK